MNKRFVLVLVSILLIAGVVFAATQDFTLQRLSQTTRIQALHPLTDVAPETPKILEEELLAGLLTEEQRKAFDEQRTDIDAAFTRTATAYQTTGDADV